MCCQALPLDLSIRTVELVYTAMLKEANTEEQPIPTHTFTLDSFLGHPWGATSFVQFTISMNYSDVSFWAEGITGWVIQEDGIMAPPSPAKDNPLAQLFQLLKQAGALLYFTVHTAWNEKQKLSHRAFLYLPYGLEAFARYLCGLKKGDVHVMGPTSTAASKVFLGEVYRSIRCISNAHSSSHSMGNEPGNRNHPFCPTGCELNSNRLGYTVATGRVVTSER